jgi:hypothetical protein
MQHRLVQKVETTSKLVEEFIFTKQELQHFVDIYFNVIMASMVNILDYNVTKEDFYKGKEGFYMGEDGLRNKYMENAARLLREHCGIHTEPVGMSWGVIKKVEEVK